MLRESLAKYWPSMFVKDTIHISKAVPSEEQQQRRHNTKEIEFIELVQQSH